MTREEQLGVRLLVIVCLFGAALASVQDSWKDYFQDKLLRVLDSTQRPKRETAKSPPNALVKFEDCGHEEDPFQVHYVTVDPNPVVFPGEMKVGFSMYVKENKTSPVKGELVMSKKISLLFGLESWFDIPCIDNAFGTCTFDDICDNVIIKEGLCRKMEDSGVEHCGCPFIQGNYTTKPVPYKVPAFPEDLPTYLLRGEFLVKATLSKDGQELACYQATFFLEV